MSRALVLFCAFVFAAPGMAAAEWHITPLVGLTFKGRTSGSGLVDLEDATGKVHKHFGAAVSFIRVGTVGLEAVFVDAPRFFTGERADLVAESRSIALMGNVILTAPRQWTEYTLRPFVSGGLGLMRVNYVDKLAVFSVRESLGGFNVGGGAIGFVTKRTGIRFDLRYFSTLRPVGDLQFSTADDRIHYFTLSVGVVIRP